MFRCACSLGFLPAIRASSRNHAGWRLRGLTLSISPPFSHFIEGIPNRLRQHETGVKSWNGAVVLSFFSSVRIPYSFLPVVGLPNSGSSFHTLRIVPLGTVGHVQLFAMSCLVLGSRSSRKARAAAS
jgi:hypothetical protein